MKSKFLSTIKDSAIAIFTAVIINFVIPQFGTLAIASAITGVVFELRNLNLTLKDSNDNITIEPFVDNKILRNMYTRAIDLYSKRDYKKSIDLLNRIKLEPSFKKENKADKAYLFYWIGENQFGLGEYEKALVHFNDSLENEWHNFYLSTQKKLASIFMTAKCYEKSEDIENAIVFYERLIEMSKYNYSQPIFDDAAKRLKRLK